MPRTRSPYPAEFRDQIIALAFEPCVATIHRWIKQAERDDGTRSFDNRQAHNNRDGVLMGSCSTLKP